MGLCTEARAVDSQRSLAEKLLTPDWILLFVNWSVPPQQAPIYSETVTQNIHQYCLICEKRAHKS